MRAILLLGGLAAGVLYYVYDYYFNREDQQRENPHGHRGSSLSDEEFIEIETSPKKLLTSKRRRKLPKPEDVCSVCLDELIIAGDNVKSLIIVLPCDHWFHQRCAVRLLEYHPNCPVCRAPIDRDVLRQTPVRIHCHDNPSANGTTSNNLPTTSNMVTRPSRRKNNKSD